MDSDGRVSINEHPNLCVNVQRHLTNSASHGPGLMNGSVRPSICSMHAHINAAGPDAEKQFPGDGTVTVDRVEHHLTNLFLLLVMRSHNFHPDAFRVSAIRSFELPRWPPDISDRTWQLASL